MKASFCFMAILFIIATTSCSNEVYKPITTTNSDSMISSVPNAPGNVTVVVIDETTIQLNWIDNSADEDGFLISKGSRKYGWVGTDSVSKNTTFYVGKRETWEKHLSYLVMAYNAFGISRDAVSNELTFK